MADARPDGLDLGGIDRAVGLGDLGRQGARLRFAVLGQDAHEHHEAVVDRAHGASVDAEPHAALRGALRLEELGLAGAIAALGENCEKLHGLDVEMSIADNIGELDPELENAIYRIADDRIVESTIFRERMDLKLGCKVVHPSAMAV